MVRRAVAKMSQRRRLNSRSSPDLAFLCSTKNPLQPLQPTLSMTETSYKAHYRSRYRTRYSPWRSHVSTNHSRSQPRFTPLSNRTDPGLIL